MELGRAAYTLKDGINIQGNLRNWNRTLRPVVLKCFILKAFFRKCQLLGFYSFLYHGKKKKDQFSCCKELNSTTGQNIFETMDQGLIMLLLCRCLYLKVLILHITLKIISHYPGQESLL